MREVRKTLGLTDVPPVLFVSVAAEGFSTPVGLLFATLAGNSISVAAKGLTFRSSGRESVLCLGESNWEGWEDSEGVRRTPWRIFEAKWSFKFTRNGGTKE
jgi:hypothetical protein